MGLYARIIPVGIGLGISASSFLLGVLYGQAPYTFPTLFTTTATDIDFELSITHYQRWAALPLKIQGILFAVAIIGFLGLVTMIYKPKETTKLYEYTALGAYFLAVCVFLTNIRTGVAAAVHGTWGEVDEATGVNVIAASQVIAATLLFGALFIEAGRYYQTIEDEFAEAEYQKLVQKQQEEDELAQADAAKEEEKKLKKEQRNAKKYGHGAASGAAGRSEEPTIKEGTPAAVAAAKEEEKVEDEVEKIEEKKKQADGNVKQRKSRKS